MSTFLIDTGPDISLCKEDILRGYVEDPDDYCCLTGITRQEIKSLGSTRIFISIGETVLQHKV